MQKTEVTFLSEMNIILMIFLYCDLVLFWNRSIGEQVELVLMVVLGLTTETTRVFGCSLKLYKHSLSFNSLLSRGSAYICKSYNTIQ